MHRYLSHTQIHTHTHSHVHSLLYLILALASLPPSVLAVGSKRSYKQLYAMQAVEQSLQGTVFQNAQELRNLQTSTLNSRLSFRFQHKVRAFRPASQVLQG